MSIEIKVPVLPESVTDATLVAWHKKAGDRVSRDENLVDLETDKVVLEVPAPADGVLQEIKVEDGATVTAGDVLAVLAEGEGAAAAGQDEQDSEETEEAAAVEKPQADQGRPAKAGKTSPAVRRLLEEHDLEAAMVTGSGKDGRITKADVMNFLKGDERGEVTPGDHAPTMDVEEAVVGLEREEQRVPMTRLRARIA